MIGYRKLLFSIQERSLGMSEAEEALEVQTLGEDLNAAEALEVMSWFEKAVQVSLKYSMELKEKDRWFVIMRLEEVWGHTPVRPPSLTPSADDMENVQSYYRWLMGHIMFLVHPNSDSYESWGPHAEAIMNLCREFLGLPELKLLTP